MAINEPTQQPHRRQRSQAWVGHRQGRLTITAFEGVRNFNRGRATMFKFRCDCGTEFVAQKANIIGRRFDCGCSRPKPSRSAPPGASKSPLHKVWVHMIERCQNPRNKSFKDYGKRGIRVADRWLMGDGARTGFECFVADMGPRPLGNYTIERVNGHGAYEPGNCVWLPKSDQSKNRRNVRLVRIGGRVQTIPDWCAETGVDYWTAIRRVSRGWPPDIAVQKPPRSGRLERPFS